MILSSRISHKVRRITSKSFLFSVNDQCVCYKTKSKMSFFKWKCRQYYVVSIFTYLSDKLRNIVKCAEAKNSFRVHEISVFK